MSETMKAVVLDAPGPPQALKVRELPLPDPRPGWVLIEIRAFGLNRSELHTRLGLAEGVTFPRVLGIEATGVVASAPGGEFREGQQVMTLMGGMGRTFDGGYAEYTCVPASQVISFHSTLDWATLGAVPEMLQTAYGSLTIGLDAQPGQTLLISRRHLIDRDGHRRIGQGPLAHRALQHPTDRTRRHASPDRGGPPDHRHRADRRPGARHRARRRPRGA